MSKKPPLKLKPDFDQLLSKLKTARRYSFVAFLVIVVGVYGFVLLKINSFSSAQPSQTDVDSQVQSAQIPRISSTVVKQLQELQDNSVNVQTLFQQTRSNPFNN